VSKEHALAGQVKSRSIMPEPAGVDESLEIRAKPAPNVHTVPALYGICINSVN